MDKYEKFHLLVKQCLDICEEKYIQAKNGKEDKECNLTVLEGTILPELKQLYNINHESKLPADGNRYCRSYACAFRVWGWDMEHPSDLFLLLQRLDRCYKML